MPRVCWEHESAEPFYAAVSGGGEKVDTDNAIHSGRIEPYREFRFATTTQREYSKNNFRCRREPGR
ncbi:MAG: hypothetical protein M1472_02940 [Planctomycetes bacterium]|nr:hypothetical protein [Planctomycetota bacterium]